MRNLYNLSVAVEAVVAFALLIAPSAVITLLFGEGLGPVGMLVARGLGLALLALAMSGWEAAHSEEVRFSRYGLCLYNTGAGVMLVLADTIWGARGALLWPAVGLHLPIGVLMMIDLFLKNKKA